MTTHQELCERAARWLKGTKRCTFAVWEIVCWSGEICDAIGFSGWESFMVECKISRADFLRDKNKFHRKNPAKGMGQFRYYLCPPGVIKPEDLPPSWGLLYTAGTKIRPIVPATKQESNHFGERTLLTSIIRRGLERCPHLAKKMIPYPKPKLERIEDDHDDRCHHYKPSPQQ